MGSFYGSRYYQATDAFAKILIKNSGLNKKTFPTESLPSEIIIGADGRTGELHLDTGNRWIKFKGNNNENKCTIYHDKADSSADTFINVINKDNKIPDLDNNGNTVIKDGEVILDVTDGVRFTVPLIYYDEAGHLSIPENGQQLTQSFVIPKIATAQEIDALKDRMTNIEEQMSTVHEALDGVSGIANEAKVKAEYTQTEFNSFRDIANGWKGQIDNLKEQVDALRTLTTNLTNDIYDLKGKIGNL